VKNNLLRKILAAGGLARGGKLMEATAAIQRALTSITPSAAVRPARAGAREASPAASTEPGSLLDGFLRDIKSNLRAANDGAAASVAEAPTVVQPAEPAFVDSTFTGAAGTRAFKLFEPAGFGAQALPLLVMLHGCTQSPDDFAAGTRMNELAQQEGLFVLYPAQAPRSNAHKCWNWFTPGDQRRGAGEPSLIAGMTRHVLRTHPIDGARVYVAGLSAGGAMAAILAREYPDLFAAAGIHSGVPAGAAHDVASAFAVMKAGPSAAAAPLAFRSAPPGEPRPAAFTPVIVFHGDADSTVAAANGDAVIDATLGAERNATRIEAESVAGREGRSFQRKVWRAADADAKAPSLAEHWIVHGAPHAWSGGASAGSYTDPSGPDASREMLRFFREHPRADERR
jgi:poly(hydroxyalkanoate) depolymerase family esterase